MSKYRILAAVALCLCARTVAAQAVFINEIHYDNASTDANEAVEVAAPALTNLTGWSIVLYNGGNGASYATYSLTGQVPELCAGYGTISVATPGIQNGAPDGVALVNASSAVVQFLSYEGTMTAADGPAAGMTSVDIGVSEPGTGAATSSLALTGTGQTYPNFTWAVAPTASFGACNTGQTFTGGVDNAPIVFTTTPANNATGVLPTANLSVNFSENVTLAPNPITLTCTNAGAIAGTVTGSNRDFTFDPAVNLTPADTCTWTVLAAAVTDVSGGNSMSANYVSTFTVSTDAPPTVTSTVPANSATMVRRTANLVANFSEPVTLNPGAFTVSCTVSGAHALTITGGPQQFTADPTTDFDYLETCTWTIVAAQVLDQDGVATPMSANVVVSFGTEQSLASYYASADATTATTLRTTLHAIIDDHTRYPYTGTGTDTWDIIEQGDEDPLDPTRVLDIYKNTSFPKAGGGNVNYNREHTWPKSYGFPDDTSTNYPYTDTHMLMVAESGYNSARNNRYYDYCADSCTEYPTANYNGHGGGSGVYPGNSNWGKGDRWETWDFRKGDVARAVLYMDVRYEGGTNGFGAAEPDLVVTDNPALIQITGTNTTGIAYMGLRSVLLAWHQADPPDEYEIMRNTLVQTYQGNRNPFVDHPEWVACVFQNVCQTPPTEDVFASGFE